MGKEDSSDLHDPLSGGVLVSMEELADTTPRTLPSIAPTRPQTTFEEFFDVHHGRLFGTLCLVTRDSGEAEDLMQEAFMRVFQRWSLVQKHENPPGYLYRTAFNLQRNRRRQALRAARRTLALLDPADAFAQIDLRDELMVALGALTVRQRTAVVLTDLLDFPSSEAAEMLGVRPATVRALASQGRVRLREQLERLDG